MTNQENIAGLSPETEGEFQAGQRSITQRVAKSRFEILREKQERGKRGRPFIYVGLVILALLMVVIGVEFWNKFVAPPRALAIRVGEVEYSRGDVVDLIRFNQKLSEELGIPFQLGSSVFEALQVIQEAELSFQLAPQFGVSISPEDVDERVEFILGFNAIAEGGDNEEFRTNVNEAKRQFLNRVGLPESVWREFLKKVLFQERLREVVGDSIPRIQPQVHVFRIMLADSDPAVIGLIERELDTGATIEEIVREFSQDPAAPRDRGDLGWTPQGVVIPQLDRLLFGLDEEGNRLHPLGALTVPQFDDATRLWAVFIVDEFQEAREVEPEALEILKDSAMSVFLNEQRKDIDLYLDLNSDIANWVNKQVSLNAAVAPPAPANPQDQFGGLIPGAAPTVAPTPARGIPGISIPVN